MTTREIPLTLAESVLNLITDIRLALSDRATHEDWFDKFVIALNSEDLAALREHGRDFAAKAGYDSTAANSPVELWGCKTITGDLERGDFIVGYKRAIPTITD